MSASILIPLTKFNHRFLCSRVPFIPVIAWVWATQIILCEALSPQGRKRIRSAGPTLVAFFKCAIEHPQGDVRSSNEITIRACEVLSKFTIDFWDIHYITRHGFLTHMLNSLTCVLIGRMNLFHS